jgi:hypothetical protein
MTFLLVQDLLTNDTTLLQFTECDQPTSFVKCVNYLKMKYDMDNLYFTVNQDFKSCNVYKQTEVLKRGWVWNSTESVNKALFKLKVIECETTSKKANASTQTDNLVDYNFYDNLLEDVDFNEDNNNEVYTTPHINDFTIGTGYANTMFFTNPLRMELQYKLSLPNNGLKATNYNFM